MTGRVGSTEEVLQRISQMQTLIDGDFQNAVTALNNQGAWLADSGEWQGRHHDDFVPIWQEFYGSMQKMQESLTELRQKIDQINTAIMAAGGNM